MDFLKLSQTYVDDAAKNYDNTRIGQNKWAQEQKAMEQLLGYIPDNSTLADIPVGTGRFFPFYKAKQLTVKALDISEDMLNQARQKGKEQENKNVEFTRENILGVSLEDRAVTTCVCVRLLNWLDWALVEQAFSEIHRVADEYVIVGIRHRVPWSNLIRPSMKVKKICNRTKLFVKRAVRSQDLVYHSEREVAKLFEDSKVDVLAKVCVQERGDGTDYYLYLLKKH